MYRLGPSLADCIRLFPYCKHYFFITKTLADHRNFYSLSEPGWRAENLANGSMRRRYSKTRLYRKRAYQILPYIKLSKNSHYSTMYFTPYISNCHRHTMEFNELSIYQILPYIKDFKNSHYSTMYFPPCISNCPRHIMEFIKLSCSQ